MFPKSNAETLPWLFPDPALNPVFPQSMPANSRPLAERTRDVFAPEIQRRGQEYVRQGRVSLQAVDEDALWATARGSSGRSYEIDLYWADRGRLEVSCTCPHFQNAGGTCKHLWATILAFDAERIGYLVPASQHLNVVAMDDVELGSFDSVPFEAAPKWQQWLGAIERFVPPSVIPKEARRQAFYLLEEAQDFISDACLRVWFYRRDELQKGGFGKLKPSPVSFSELVLFEAEDSALFRMLLGLGRGDWEGLTSDASSSNSRRRSVAIGPALFETVLPKLSATGRFGWLVDKPKRGFSPLIYEPSPEWRLEMVGESSGERMQLRGFFVRESAPVEQGNDPLSSSRVERRPLDEARVAFAGGELVFEESIGRLAFASSHFPWIVSLRAEPDLYIPHEDIPAALEAMGRIPGLPPLRLPESLDWPSVRPAPQPCLVVTFDQDTVSGRAQFIYGMRRIDVADPIGSWIDQEARQLVHRDVATEARFLLDLKPFGNRATTFSQHVGAFLEASDQLRERGWRIEAEGKTLRATGSFSAKVSSGASQGMDWFELEGAMSFDQERVELPALLQAAGRGESFIALEDGSLGMLPMAWLERFAPLSKLLSKRGGDQDALRFENHQALFLDALLAAQPEVEIDAVFAGVRAKLRSFEGLEPAVAPAGFCGELRPYQEQGLAWLTWLGELGLGGCLADDMGLGKTIQVLALLEQRRHAVEIGVKTSVKTGARVDARPSLLVVPRSLMHNWHSEAARFTPELEVHLHHGLDRAKSLEERLAGSDSPLIVTTYGTLRRDIAKLRRIEFDVAVLDEAQAIKNASSQTAKACRLVRSRHRLVLTGTPVENHLGELFSLLEFLNPGMLGRLPATASMAGRAQLPAESLEILARAIRPLVLRRTKSQVLKDLPTKTEQTLYCELSNKERSRYDELLLHYRAQLGEKVRTIGLGRSKVMVLEALLRLRQAACHGGLMDPDLRQESSAKLDVLLERLREVVGEGDKALVFSQFTRFLSMVRERLDREGLVYEYLDGRTRDRQAKVDRFQGDADCPIFLISLKAGGVGLNLTAASYVFLLDPWWNPAVEAQAIDRVHRIGQEQPVFAYRLIARDTVEEKILELQDSKRALADAIVAQDQRFLRQMTAEDLALLLGGPLGR